MNCAFFAKGKRLNSLLDFSNVYKFNRANTSVQLSYAITCYSSSTVLIIYVPTKQ